MEGGALKSVDVIIVGAGWSGLYARPIFKTQAWLTILNIEAKDRVGGKTCSVSNGRRGIVDVGAAWMNDTTQRRIYVTPVFLIGAGAIFLC